MQTAGSVTVAVFTALQVDPEEDARIGPAFCAVEVVASCGTIEPKSPTNFPDAAETLG